MLAYQLTDFMPWKLDVNSLQCLLQLHNRYEAISISIDLTQTQAFQHYITTSHFISTYKKETLRTPHSNIAAMTSPMM